MSQVTVGSHWRHKAHGSYYTVIHIGTMQCASFLLDDLQVVVYLSEDGRVRVRPMSEFADGRYESVP